MSEHSKGPELTEKAEAEKARLLKLLVERDNDLHAAQLERKRAERERDEARAALRVAALRVHRMSPYHDDDPDTCEHEECSLVRAALGEKP